MHVRAYKFRIKPTRAVQTRFREILTVCCELYNAALQERRDAWRIARKSISYYSQCAQLSDIRSERADIRGVYSQILQDVLKRLNRSFDHFFRRVRAGEKPGYPRFKSRAYFNSFCYTQSGFRLDGDKLVLSKLGSVKVKMHRPVMGKIKTCTIKNENGRWYVIFTAEQDATVSLVPINEIVGIDVGLTRFAMLSTGEYVNNPRFFRCDEKALARAHRKLSAIPKKMSKHRVAIRIVGTIYRRIRNRRSNFAHQLSRYLVNRFGAVFFEDLRITELLKGNLAKSISDAAWRQFINYTSYKAENAGRICRRVDPRNTSRLTACCGELVEMALSDRVIRCPKCHSETDRDLNASFNILARGLTGFGLSAVEVLSFIRQEIATVGEIAVELDS